MQNTKVKGISDSGHPLLSYLCTESIKRLNWHFVNFSLRAARKVLKTHFSCARGPATAAREQASPCEIPGFTVLWWRSSFSTSMSKFPTDKNLSKSKMTRVGESVSDENVMMRRRRRRRHKEKAPDPIFRGFRSVEIRENLCDSRPFSQNYEKLPKFFRTYTENFGRLVPESRPENFWSKIGSLVPSFSIENSKILKSVTSLPKFSKSRNFPMFGRKFLPTIGEIRENLARPNAIR